MASTAPPTRMPDDIKVAFMEMMTDYVKSRYDDFNMDTQYYPDDEGSYSPDWVNTYDLQKYLNINILHDDAELESWEESIHECLEKAGIPKPDWLDVDSVYSLFLYPVLRLWEKTIEGTPGVNDEDIPMEEVRSMVIRLCDTNPYERDEDDGVERDIEEEEDEARVFAADEKFWHAVSDSYIKKLETIRDTAKRTIVKRNNLREKLRKRKAKEIN